MAMSNFLLFVDITVILMLSISHCHGAVEDDRKVYIAYLGAAPDREDIASSQHSAMLQSLSALSCVENYLIKSYKRSFNGFAAKLTNEEAKKLASFKEVVSVFPSKVYHLQTTRSWDFLGLNQTVKRNATAESNVIVGVLDTGIWPESDSFSDEGFGPPPKKWKGACKGGQNFTCNNKLIGARSYHSDSARDTEGHGTHTASTAAGNNVVNASFYGLAEGIARGGVPSARIAAYKVCSGILCLSEDILAGFDDAIADGVDLISVSLGLEIPVDLYEDPVAIGAFHAAEKGVLVLQSAGNSGTTGFQSVSSVAPWILSVAASTTDRLFVDKVVLGNGWKTLTGFSVNSFSLNRTKVPLVYGLQITSSCDEAHARACYSYCLNKTLVKNKIVLCDVMNGVNAAYDAGALGLITKYQVENVSFVVPLSAITLSSKDYDLVISYHNSTKEPKAEILRSETIKDKFAPIVASFSSRGPNAFVPDILKPDISAPGVDILAAYSPVASPSTTTTDPRRVKYNIISGTSMSCPHVAGVAAYVKTFHPLWSPSAVKSALMTTAFPMDAPRTQGAEFAYGSGHINPVKAIDPGLVYDTVEGDNIRFLCSKPFKVTFHRTVTNVGVARSTYNATIAALSELEIKVVPQVLSFKCLTEKMSYKVYIAYLGSLPDGDYIASSHHCNMLSALSKHSSLENHLIRSYKRSFNGFAAKLTNEEAKKLSSFKGVVSVFPSKVYHLHTTRSWDFLGLNQTVKRNATESDVIVGVFDTGIWPESDSFSDEGFGPPPQKWKGACKGGQNFTCNNKLIGARVYITDSARDKEGHGSHTASTAAGNNVVNASFYGFAEGTARGGVPSARIAAYKVCNGICTSEDILAAFDDAIADGVDLITASLGSFFVFEFYSDAVAIGAFHAAEKGVLVVQSAGNSGLAGFQSVASVAPWILSVAASTMDRHFVNKVVLGNGKTLTGLSINTFSLNRAMVPLVYGMQASSDCDEFSARLCFPNCLNKTLVKNKIILCDDMQGVDEAYNAGALGLITKYGFDDVAYVVPMPAITLSSKDYDSVTSYLNSTKQPKAEILISETITDKSAPIVASFSSKGPNFIVPDILKPDISAPGVDILAAYSPVASPSITTTDTRRVKYNIISGTSMSCPHVAGVAAYVKTFHPHWSPSAIKSALMTTAFPMDAPRNQGAEFAYGSGHINPVKAIDPGLVYDNVKGDNIRFLCSIGYDEGSIKNIAGNNTSCPKNSFSMDAPRNQGAEFAYGSGHVNPVKAIDPGLVYDTVEGDNIRFLCSIGYDEGSIKKLAGNYTSCPKNSTKMLPRDFNYPTLTALVPAGKPFKVTFHRTVTNVAVARSTYNATIATP
ncbi:hypothetical protein ES319_D08G002100v1 [Gossypium barbadense]|uniref:Uncharacterized protein n=2 Tax=Gossypium TaxID=3633 RepID=A0A5J5Q9F1_GOSBA|nr:hypothetical protein ES319_D08G002100v1 [Gossypium barbadense]TYG55687.1 hypothetical protein ES288_D08G002700v1 [Gossypium darwinii]